MARYKGAKGKAWEAVKKFTRAREKDCYTCPSKNLQGINHQAGHYLPVALVGSNNTLSWDERAIHSQCSRCNGPGQGMAVEYRRHLVRDVGEEIVKEFEARRWKIDPIKNWDEVILRYTRLHDQLVKRL